MESQFISFIDNILENEDITNAFIDQWFNKMDSNKNNKIEYEEFSVFMVDFFKLAKITQMTPIKVKELFHKLDIDTNGIIDRKKLQPLIKKILLYLKGVSNVII